MNDIDCAKFRLLKQQYESALCEPALCEYGERRHRFRNIFCCNWASGISPAPPIFNMFCTAVQSAPAPTL